MFHCTNPQCRKPLEIARLGKQQYQPLGVVVLTCNFCGFEFAVQAESGNPQERANGFKWDKGIGSKSKIDFELAALKAKIKAFNLV